MKPIVFYEIGIEDRRLVPGINVFKVMPIRFDLREVAEKFMAHAKKPYCIWEYRIDRRCGKVCNSVYCSHDEIVEGCKAGWCQTGDYQFIEGDEERFGKTKQALMAEVI